MASIPLSNEPRNGGLEGRRQRLATGIEARSSAPNYQQGKARTGYGDCRSACEVGGHCLPWHDREPSPFAKTVALPVAYQNMSREVRAPVCDGQCCL
jgi:hypothetical protein